MWARGGSQDTGMKARAKVQAPSADNLVDVIAARDIGVTQASTKSNSPTESSREEIEFPSLR